MLLYMRVYAYILEDVKTAMTPTAPELCTSLAIAKPHGT
jgi:hypothetical protein